MMLVLTSNKCLGSGYMYPVRQADVKLASSVQLGGLASPVQERPEVDRDRGSDCASLRALRALRGCMTSSDTRQVNSAGTSGVDQS